MDYMEMTLAANNILRVKGKQGAIVVDPSLLLTSKTQADAVLVLVSTKNLSLTRIEGYRVIISGPGEYEIGGMKISGERVNKQLLYELRFEGLTILLAKAGTIEAIKEKADQYHVLVLCADKAIDPSVVTALTPSVVALYGEKATELSRALGKEGKSVEKYSVTNDKLPAEMEVVVLA